jgi:hypothetical protein
LEGAKTFLRKDKFEGGVRLCSGTGVPLYNTVVPRISRFEEGERKASSRIFHGGASPERVLLPMALRLYNNPGVRD